MRFKLSAALLLCPFLCQAQEAAPYSRRNAISLFADYANSSSHIILGVSGDRRLADLGVGYSRRLVHSRLIDWNYDLELHPVRLLQDPTDIFTLQAINGVPANQPPSYKHPNLRACASQMSIATVTPRGQPSITYTYTNVCGTRWTYAGGISPLGQRINLITRHRLQPYFVGNGGFMAANRDIPVEYSSRFNFTFEFGAGLTWFQDHRRSWSLDYRLHHLSNDYIGATNPGVDSQLFRVGYAFGR